MLSVFLDTAIRLDVSLSKVEMILKESKVSSFSYTDTLFKENRHTTNAEMATLHRLNEKIERNDQFIVDRLHDIYSNFERASTHILEIRKLIESHGPNNDKVCPIFPSLPNDQYLMAQQNPPTEPLRQ